MEEQEGNRGDVSQSLDPRSTLCLSEDGKDAAAIAIARYLDPASKEALVELIECLQHNGERERIACSAIWFNDGKEHPHQPKGRWNGFVVFGLGHHQCFTTLAAVADFQAIKKLPSEQGFVTTWNRFVTREEAAGIAFLAGQTHDGKYPRRLFSEDIFYRPRVTDCSGPTGGRGPSSDDTREKPDGVIAGTPKDQQTP
jgi:hypothetical protein